MQRRFAKAAATAFTGGVATTQRRFDHDRWYGHALELDLFNYKFTNELPKHMKFPDRTEEEVRMAIDIMPAVDFSTSYELLTFDADRLNHHLNRKEFGNEMKFRLEKLSNTVTRAQALIKEGKYANDVNVEDTMIARIADEEHVYAEMKYVKTIRANELAEDNRLDILPGGSPNSLREKTRWNLQTELHVIDREEINKRLMAWLPEKYHIVYYDDFQTVAANDVSARQQMQKIVEDVQKDCAGEAKANGWEADLNESVAELQDDIDPTRAITNEAIKACTSLDQLEQWSRAVHEYNGDERIVNIYARAAEITGDAAHKKLVEDMRKTLFAGKK